MVRTRLGTKTNYLVSNPTRNNRSEDSPIGNGVRSVDSSPRPDRPVEDSSSRVQQDVFRAENNSSPRSAENTSIDLNRDESKPKVFVADPYKGNINPATDRGFNLYKEATAKLPTADRIKMSPENAQKLLRLLERDAKDFGWGKIVHRVYTSPSQRKSILRNYNKVSIENVKKQAYLIWGNKNANFHSQFPEDMQVEDLDPEKDVLDEEIFYLRVRSGMIAKRIAGILTPDSYNSLLLQKKDFSWMEEDGEYVFDGPTMLIHLLKKINPSTRVGISDLSLQIQEARMNKFNNNVVMMLDHMNNNYQQIEAMNEQHPNYIMHLFHALLSAKNEIFVNYVQTIKDNWETGKDVSADELINEAKTKYNNMVKQKIWNKQSPKDAKIMALATELRNLKDSVTNYGGGKSKNSSTSKNLRINIPEWRMLNTGPTKVVDGVKYWWCKHHKLENVFDGLYMTHKPEDHSKWKEEKEKKKAEYKKKQADRKVSDTQKSGKKLQLSDRLKSAMVTNFCCSNEQAENVWAEVAQNF